MDPFEKLALFVKIGKELTAKGRKQIKEENFAIPEEKKYPIHDIEHARNALARVSQFGTPEERRRVREAVYRRYPSLREEFEERHGVSPLSKKVLTKKKLTNVEASQKAAMAAQAMAAAVLKTAAADLLEALALGED